MSPEECAPVTAAMCLPVPVRVVLCSCCVWSWGARLGGVRAASTMTDISKQQKMLPMKLCPASSPAAVWRPAVGLCCCAALPAHLD